MDNHPAHTTGVWTALPGPMVDHTSPTLTRPPWTTACPHWRVDTRQCRALGSVPTVGLSHYQRAKLKGIGYRGLAPLLPDGGGLELGESFALPGRGLVGSFPPDVPDGAGAIA